MFLCDSFATNYTSTMPVFIHAKLLNAGSTTPIIDLSLVLSEPQPSAYLGIQNVESANLSVFPNLAKEAINIKGRFDSNATVTILDQTRRIVKPSEELTDFTTINLSSINKTRKRELLEEILAVFFF